VTLPKFSKVVLSDFLLHGNLSVHRTDDELTSETNLTVAIKTIPAPPPPSMRLKGGKVDLEKDIDEDTDEENDGDDDENSDLFVLCALTFGHPHHPPHPPHPAADSEVSTEESLEDGELSKRHPPHRRPPPPPVVIGIFVS
jgi:hypothetical protein